ncbi:MULTISPECIES: DUF4282 domain-containing protein [Yersinia]|jgi:NADH:ubiquinone oxidoreductase subunit 6 (subunit J)|uniref:DUF4282 domain-containing protein n=1 Tax=Yersinia intermedia TaxID=631 RepID=A0A0T9MQW1_YERIN|nr:MULTISPECIES: DUF4282 domain-containing protein [Yersinia]AJJ17395.1 hypothetical protein CH53_1835 [Yersinia intermedia]ARB83260.1 DUF4282 domain-containing protein [Yersinia sp. FDAARGOS_228]AVL37016.1 DUF4282 domain-containing protein [Yersinia intermedia]EEQ17657.1 hypothetical protein yinte0001_38670 [Yersinia intermedia ATCC 29909]MCB5300193.1 DUF4282 domain-containing protein [Yersinia intermedia]
MLKNVLFFDALLTPKILTGLYWLLLVFIIISGVFVMINTSVIGGFLSILGGALATRICFEMIMIAFKNNEYLKKIADKS